MSWEALIVLAGLYCLYVPGWRLREKRRRRAIRYTHRKSKYYASKIQEPTIRKRN